MIAVLWLVSGLVLLIIGAELVIRGGTRLAAHLGVKPLLLGLTVVSIGTSMPELAVGITASSQGSGSLAVGNITGTNIFNILFILGLSALLRPLPMHMQVLKLDLPIIVGTAFLMTALAWDGLLSPADGFVLVLAAIAYTVALVKASRVERNAVKAEFSGAYSTDSLAGKEDGTAWPVHVAWLTAGMGITILGADWLVDGAVDMARMFGVSELMIGLTIVAIGTSAPELVTTIIATLKDERDIAIGNLLGSSIYNILVILGLTCAATPKGVPVDSRLLWVDIPLMIGVAIACVPVFVTGRRVSRLEGALFVGMYVAYMTVILVLELR